MKNLNKKFTFLETLKAIEKVVKAWETLGSKEKLLPDVAMRVVEIIYETKSHTCLNGRYGSE